ncbi:MAG TPA: acetyl-CoA carboxylase carboxyltransferase subunit alpha [Ktedonobacteraceae bacterium]|jgi:acetyl-CoA carboxylase carboxyl transferase subunit alpha|nr:acetyl-CoA carboxylase carboxyltransferase subunit alpha [Ktedonobacteraceae bacterium]
MAYDLEFEKPLAELEKKITALQRKGDRLKPDERTQLQALEQDLLHRTEAIYRDLTPWQTVLVARHKDRPHTTDYVKLICDNFFEMHGDRTFGDDHAIIAGPTSIGDQKVMVIGHEKGRDMKERIFRNNGMPHPEGYRKTARLMRQAEKFAMPIVAFIDVSGASPGLEDEERGQSEAIAANLYLMSRLHVPIVAIVIGEGGSGGAMAISIADRILMLENSYYTAAAPEAAASIMWRDSKQAPQAAEAMHISAREVYNLELADELIAEPLGGAHRNYQQAAENIKAAILKQLATLKELSIEQLLEQRYQKFRVIGPYGRAEMPQVSAISSV